MTGSASPLELTWTVVAALSTLFSVFDVARAIWEVRQHRHDHGPTRGIGWSGLAKSLLLFTMTVLALGLGILSIATPRPYSDANRDFQDWAAAVLIVYQILLACVIATKDWERWYVSQWEWAPTRKRNPEGQVPTVLHETMEAIDDHTTQ